MSLRNSWKCLVQMDQNLMFIHGMITSLSDNNNLFEIPYDNYPITSDLSTISDASISGVSISSFSNASISDASISDEQPIVRSSRPTDRKHKIPY
ncbi:hypothetical protein RhiirC2_774002 [Rhizophagus irregularis]|uniref:Uncharacterized protein n=1 Tax=Rhizophagus irregularis TaxID=588596 RepID=A0A2N1NMK5_9GLOM|nr:hypothetical protein RhiirC2_774002 [Rhizophagus irregularis]